MAEDKSLAEQVDLIVRPFVRINALAVALAGRSEIIDISKPNFHNSKAEFREELEYVENALELCDKLFETIKSGLIEPSGTAREVNAFINRTSLSWRERKPPEHPTDLIVENAISSGLTYSLVLLLLEYRGTLRQRKAELKDQEKQFWNVSYRPPNYYARTIALRIARAYAQCRGEKPTYGTSRDGGHPSTDFGRVLEQVFDILSIEARVPTHARWAIQKLTKEDLQRSPDGSLVDALRNSNPQSKRTGLLEYISELGEKGGDD